jgi:hypothetical protein
VGGLYGCNVDQHLADACLSDVFFSITFLLINILYAHVGIAKTSKYLKHHKAQLNADQRCTHITPPQLIQHKNLILRTNSNLVFTNNGLPVRLYPNILDDLT